MFELQFKSMMQGATEGIDEFHKVGKLSNQIKQLLNFWGEREEESSVSPLHQLGRHYQRQSAVHFGVCGFMGQNLVVISF